MKCALISATAFALLLTLPRLAAAEDLSSSIVGVWKFTGFTSTEVTTGKVRKLYGEHPGGMAVYTKGGRYVAFGAGDRKAPAKAEPTDAERIELFKTMFAHNGTYKVDGNKLVQRADTSWIESWTGLDRSLVVEIKGNQMTLTSAPFKSIVDGKDVFTTNIWERVE